MWKVGIVFLLPALILGELDTSFSDENTKADSTCWEGEYSAGEECAPCPSNTVLTELNATICQCKEDTYRAYGEGPEIGCTATPSSPRNLRVKRLHYASVTLAWDPPADMGGRDDIWYDIRCGSCSYADEDMLRIIHHLGLHQIYRTKFHIRHLQPGKRYTFLVNAINGVSSKAQAINYEGIEIQTPHPPRHASVGAKDVSYPGQTSISQMKEVISELKRSLGRFEQRILDLEDNDYRNKEGNDATAHLTVWNGFE